MNHELGLWLNVTSRRWLAASSFLGVLACCVYPQWLHQNVIHFAANSASIHFLWDLSRCLHSAVVEQWCLGFSQSISPHFLSVGTPIRKAQPGERRGILLRPRLQRSIYVWLWQSFLLIRLALNFVSSTPCPVYEKHIYISELFRYPNIQFRLC